MILPIGTKVVTKAAVAGTPHVYPEGTLAVIVDTPVDASHSYRVRISDGFETNLTRDQFVLLRTLQEAGRRLPEQPAGFEQLDEFVTRVRLA